MTRLGIIFLAFALLPLTVHAVLTNITNVCSPSATFPPVIQGELTFVCVNINNKFRAVFTPTVDKFSVISIRECTYSM